MRNLPLFRSTLQVGIHALHVLQIRLAYALRHFGVGAETEVHELRFLILSIFHEPQQSRIAPLGVVLIRVARSLHQNLLLLPAHLALRQDHRAGFARDVLGDEPVVELRRPQVVVDQDSPVLQEVLVGILVRDHYVRAEDQVVRDYGVQEGGFVQGLTERCVYCFGCVEVLFASVLGTVRVFGAAVWGTFGERVPKN